MFGLENKKKESSLHFDLEHELKDLKYKKELLKRIEEKIQKLKTTLRQGEDKQDFDRLGILLNGYTALLKVLSHTGKKK